jgi:hypothetical protein
MVPTVEEAGVLTVSVGDVAVDDVLFETVTL